MSSVKRLYDVFERSDGRIKLMTLLGVSGLVAVLAVFMVLPAAAGSGAPSGSGVQPVEVSYGGGSGACAVYSSAAYELHINNPIDGTFTGPDGTRVSIDVSPNPTNPTSSDMYFDFQFVNNPTMYAFDIVVNGGSKNTHYDYDGGSGAVRSDTSLHAPTKGGSNNLYNLSHINICYGVNPVADLSVEKTPVPAADPFLADVGDQVTFSITVSNAGPLDATGVEITDDLPEGMTYVSSTDGGSHSNGTVTWSNLSIASGSSKTVTLVVLIGDAAAGQDVVNGVSVTGDQDDPNDTNDSASSVPPVTVTADISGIKYHDKDTDGTRDPTEEGPLADWTITAFDEEGTGFSADTNADGEYTIADLAPGTYTVCEATNSDGLPGSGFGFDWYWTQSQPAEGADCSGYDGYEPVGYTVEVGEDGDVDEVDFGNHRQVGIDCSAGDVTLVLGGPLTEDDPQATVVVEEDSPSCNEENAPWLVTFEVGRSELLDQTVDDFEQFVVFGDGAAPNPDTTITFQIEWDAEPADYVDGDLVVPTTRVSYPDLADIENLSDAVRCNTDPDLPDVDTPLCLDSRVILEGGDLGTDIQVTEDYIGLGDPGYFR